MMTRRIFIARLAAALPWMLKQLAPMPNLKPVAPFEVTHSDEEWRKCSRRANMRSCGKAGPTALYERPPERAPARQFRRVRDADLDLFLDHQV